MVHPIVHVVDWDLVKKRKAKMLLQSNASENKKRLKYSYQKGQKVLIVNKDIKRKLSCPTFGPYTISEVHPDTGNVTIKKGSVEQRINIRRIKPFCPSSESI